MNLPKGRILQCVVGVDGEIKWYLELPDAQGKVYYFLIAPQPSDIDKDEIVYLSEPFEMEV